MHNKFYQFLGLIKRSGNLIEGYNKCEETIKRQNVYLLLLSKECAHNTKKKFIKYCDDKSIKIIDDIPKEELGKALGRNEINVLCVKDRNMSDRLLNLWNECEVI